eukprot:Gb_16187 [translate_table: standard]
MEEGGMPLHQKGSFLPLTLGFRSAVGCCCLAECKDEKGFFASLYLEVPNGCWASFDYSVAHVCSGLQVRSNRSLQYSFSSYDDWFFMSMALCFVVRVGTMLLSRLVPVGGST